MSKATSRASLWAALVALLFVSCDSPPPTAVEVAGVAYVNERRRSNSSTQALGDFKTKFEAIDQDPVFEEELHGPTDDDMEHASTISKEESVDSTLEGSGQDEADLVNKKL